MPPASPAPVLLSRTVVPSSTRLPSLRMPPPPPPSSPPPAAAPAAPPPVRLSDTTQLVSVSVPALLMPPPSSASVVTPPVIVAPVMCTAPEWMSITRSLEPVIAAPTPTMSTFPEMSRSPVALASSPAPRLVVVNWKFAGSSILSVAGFVSPAAQVPVGPEPFAALIAARKVQPDIPSALLVT